VVEFATAIDIIIQIPHTADCNAAGGQCRIGLHYQCRVHLVNCSLDQMYCTGDLRSIWLIAQFLINRTALLQ